MVLMELRLRKIHMHMLKLPFHQATINLAINLFCDIYRVAGIVEGEPLRHAVDATRPDTVVHSVSTKTGPVTCTTVHLVYKVSLVNVIHHCGIIMTTFYH